MFIWKKSTDHKCRGRFRTPPNIKTVFNGINPENNFAINSQHQQFDRVLKFSEKHLMVINDTK